MYHLDIYLRQNTNNHKEIASFVDPKRNYKQYNLDAVLLYRDYGKEYQPQEIIQEIDLIINSNNIDKYNHIFLICESMPDYSFRDPNEKGGLAVRKKYVPIGVKIHEIATVRYDSVEKFWYVFYQPNDCGRWASNFKNNPYKKWIEEKYSIFKKK